MVIAPRQELCGTKNGQTCIQIDTSSTSSIHIDIHAIPTMPTYADALAVQREFDPVLTPR